jgi:hypothetical protein
MQAVLLEPMSNHNLLLTDYYQEETGGALECKFAFKQGRLHWWRPQMPTWQPVEVEVLIDRISKLPEEKWVDLHLFTTMDKQTAIQMGVSVITPVLSVLRSLSV